MSELIDRILIALLMVFAVMNIYHGRGLIVVLYIIIAAAFIQFYLLSVANVNDKDSTSISTMSCKVIDIALIISILFYPKLVVLLPFVFYDGYVVKSLIPFAAGLVTIFPVINSGMDIKTILYIYLVSFFSVYLAYQTKKKYELDRKYKALRDDNSEKETKLKKQTRDVLAAKDAQIYTAQLSERNRIAREIHDNVGHMLTRAILQLGALLTIYKEEPIHSQLEGMKETLDTAMNNIRSSVHDLHDDAVDLQIAVEQIVNSLKEDYTVYLSLDVDKNISKDLKFVLIGIIKEATSNIIKYSENKNVDFVLQQHPAMYQLVVHDYNKDSAKEGTKKTSDGHGIGLENIESRAKSVGGTVYITNDDGFRIFVTIPIRT